MNPLLLAGIAAAGGGLYLMTRGSGSPRVPDLAPTPLDPVNPYPAPPPMKPFPHDEVDRSVGTDTPPSGVISAPGYKIIADINDGEAKDLLQGGTVSYDAFDQVIKGPDGKPLTGPTPRTVPIAWSGPEGNGSNPGSVVWLSKDRKRAVVAWNASTPAVTGRNISTIPDNQLVWTEVGQNNLTDAIRKSWT